jgi:RNA polymerase sigma-70 factor (ECF subfamily)
LDITSTETHLLLGSAELVSTRRRRTHVSDEALIASVAGSDDAALAELYDRYGRRAYGLAFRILRDPALAEDAVQEAFLAVWRTAARFQPAQAKATTWLMTIVHRRAVDLVRREERRRTESLEGVTEAVGDVTEDLALLHAERDRVGRALAALPDVQREALELAYYGGFTQSQLAERLGEPLGTVKSRMFNGLARLRTLLQEGEGPTTPRWSHDTGVAAA